MDNTIHNIIKMKHIINAATERLQARYYYESNSQAQRHRHRKNRGFDEQSGRKTGVVAAIHISQFLSISIIHIDNNIVI
jgi:hypothetical protein